MPRLFQTIDATVDLDINKTVGYFGMELVVVYDSFGDAVNCNLHVLRFGEYNRTPFAPPGTLVQVHEPATTRSTWSPHASDGYYLGPALHAYRSFRVYMVDTNAERTVSTLTWHLGFY